MVAVYFRVLNHDLVAQQCNITVLYFFRNCYDADLNLNL